MKRHLKLLILFVSVALPAIAFASDAKMTASIQAQLRDYFRAYFDMPDSNLVVEFSKVQKYADQMPKWDSLKLHPSKRPPKKGLQIVKFGFYLNGILQEEIGVNVRVRTFSDVAVCKQFVPRNRIILQQDLRIARLETTRMKEKYFSKFPDVVGMMTTKALSPGEIVTAENLRPRPLIVRGEKIQIHFSKHGVEIILPGIARQSGAKGETVLVKCTENKKTYSGTVISSEVVAVDF